MVRLYLGNAHLFISLVFFLFAGPVLAASNPYGAYHLFSRGSGRVMAMGGVFAALSNDANAVTENPAGPAVGKWKLDAGATSNRVDNRENQTQSTNSVYDTTFKQPYSYTAYAAAARLGPIVLGAGYSNPFDYEYDNLNNSYSATRTIAGIKISSIDALIAARFGEEFGIGVSGHFQNLTQTFKQQSTNLSSESAANTISVGAVYRSKKAGFGVVYTPGVTFTIDSSKNTSIPLASWFRDVAIPSTTVFGGYIRLNDRIILAADMDQYVVSINSVDVLSGLNLPNSTDVALYTGNIQVLHFGFEWLLATDKNFELFFRGGAYQEPARIVKGESRFHRTYGLQIRFGPVELNVSYDQAANFSSTSQGFSLVLGSL